MPAKQSEVVTVDKDNVVKELIDSGYYEASQFTGLDAGTEPVSGSIPVGIVLPTKDEPRWIQDQTRFENALSEAGFDVEILFSQGDSSLEKTNVESLITKASKS